MRTSVEELVLINAFVGFWFCGRPHRTHVRKRTETSLDFFCTSSESSKAGWRYYASGGDDGRISFRMSGDRSRGFDGHRDEIRDLGKSADGNGALPLLFAAASTRGHSSLGYADRGCRVPQQSSLNS